MLLGHWKNFEDLEECLTIDEANAILEASRQQEFMKQKFAAALKGVDLDEPESESDTSFEDVKRRAEAKLSGKSEDQLALAEAGIMVIEE